MNNKIFVTLLVLLTSGCTSITSIAPNGQEEASGVVYFLPTTRIKLLVSVDETGDGISIEAAQPEYFGDPNAAFQLTSLSNPFGSDKFEMKVASNGLIQSVESESKGELDEILVEGVTSFSRTTAIFEAAIESNNRKVIYEEYIDPSSLVSGSGALTRRILSALKNTKLVSKSGNAEVRRALNGLNIGVSSLRSVVQMDEAQEKEMCEKGICYRRLMPYVISMTVGKIKKEALIHIPNGSPTYVAHLNRGVFADSNFKTAFENGMLTQYSSDRKSEVLEIMQLPGELVGAFVAGATSGLQSKASLLKAETELIEAKADHLEKKKAAQDRISAAKSKDGTASLEADFHKRGEPLFSFVIGQPYTQHSQGIDMQRGNKSADKDQQNAQNDKAKKGKTRDGSLGGS